LLPLLLPPLLQIDVGLVQQGATNAAYGLVLLCVALVAVGDGLAQPSVYADAALLPDKYTQVCADGLRLPGALRHRVVTAFNVSGTRAGPARVGNKQRKTCMHATRVQQCDSSVPGPVLLKFCLCSVL
jgi:hypothetical protein